MIPLFGGPFYLLRHGETEANAADIIAGSTDTPLTPLGRAQALAAADALTDAPISAIYASPLSRARQTAAPVAARLGLPVTILEGLAERAWGAWEGRPRAILVRAATPPGGEGPDEFADRVLAALMRIPGGGLPLIVAHSGTARVLRLALFGQDPPTPVANAAAIRFEPVAGGWRETGGPAPAG